MDLYSGIEKIGTISGVNINESRCTVFDYEPDLNLNKSQQLLLNAMFSELEDTRDVNERIVAYKFLESDFFDPEILGLFLIKVAKMKLAAAASGDLIAELMSVIRKELGLEFAPSGLYALMIKELEKPSFFEGVELHYHMRRGEIWAEKEYLIDFEKLKEIITEVKPVGRIK